MGRSRGCRPPRLRNSYELPIQRNIYKSGHNCAFRGWDWMQAPPPPMMSGMMMDRKKTMIAAAIVIGLFLLFVGAVLVDMSNAAPRPGETAEQTLAREDLGNVWGPAVAHAGMFFVEDMDIFVRLFLLIVGFVALLLVLANSPTIFG